MNRVRGSTRGSTNGNVCEIVSDNNIKNKDK